MSWWLWPLASGAALALFWPLCVVSGRCARREEAQTDSPSVEAVLKAQPHDHLAEIALYFDPQSGLWHAYPVGTPWDTCDAPPTATGPDPLAVIRALLATPALEAPSC